MLLDSLAQLCSHQGTWPPSYDRGVVLDSVSSYLLLVHRARLATALGIPARHVGIDNSRGVGQLPYIPWVRVFSRIRAPKPTAGYFVDFLAGWDGRLYIAILPGVGTRRVRELDRKREWARNVLGPRALEDYLSQVSLRAPSGIAAAYERSLVLAEEVDLENISEDGLLARVDRQLELLSRIYRAQGNKGRA